VPIPFANSAQYWASTSNCRLRPRRAICTPLMIRNVATNPRTHADQPGHGSTGVDSGRLRRRSVARRDVTPTVRCNADMRTLRSPIPCLERSNGHSIQWHLRRSPIASSVARPMLTGAARRMISGAKVRGSAAGPDDPAKTFAGRPATPRPASAARDHRPS